MAGASLGTLTLFVEGFHQILDQIRGLDGQEIEIVTRATIEKHRESMEATCGNLSGLAYPHVCSSYLQWRRSLDERARERWGDE